jgi:hypothetical protein
MDDRQTKIREGAGLEDSRINQEFIDFLNKWSTPFCILLLVAAGVYWGLNYLERQRIARVDQAFSEYEAVIADGNPSPNSLQSIAGEAEKNGIGSVAELARLREVDIYLGAFAIGLEPGAQLDPETQSVVNENDILSDERRQQYLTFAETTAKQVLGSSEGDEGKAIFAMQALSRLASVEESRDQFEAARAYYERLGTLAEAQRYSPMKTYADNRIAELDAISEIGVLPTQEQVPSLGGAGAASSLPIDLPGATTGEVETTDEAEPDSDAQAEEPTGEPQGDEPESSDEP